MKLAASDMKATIAALKEGGYDVGLRDICYVMLSRVFEEPVYAYKALFSGVKDAEQFDEYSIDDKIEELTSYLAKRIPEAKEKPEVEKIDDHSGDASKSSDDNLSFDEIKKGLEEDLASLVALRDQVDEDGNSVLDPKEMASVVGRISAVRVALVEKFGSTQENVEQRIVIAQKYNDICPFCGHEIAVDPSHNKLI